jgi:Tfp pilus assembly protein PilO
MSRFISPRLTVAALIAVAVVPVALPAQSQDSQSQSVAEAARRAKEKKKTSTKPAQVITEDNLKPATPDMQPTSASAPVQTPDASGKPAAQPAPGDAKAPAGGPASAASKDSDQKAKSLAELARLKQQLADGQKDLDILQRELVLEQDNVYSKTNYQADTAGKAKLDDIKQQISDKQQTVEDLKTRVAALQESLGNSVPAEAPAAPPQS